MAKKVALEIDVKSDSVGQAGKKVESATQELRRLKRELASGGLTGKEFEEASKRAGQLQDNISDVSQRVKNLASDTRRLDAVVSAAQGIAGGFAIAQGAAALFGDENEELQKTFVKLQATMTALNGLQAVANTLNKDSAFMTNLSTKAFTLKAAAVKLASSSLGKLKLALIATGIGAAVVAVGLLVANFDKVKQAVLNFIPGLEKVAKFFGNLIQSITDFVGITSEASREAEKFAKAAEKNNQKGKDEIAVMKARGATAEKVYAAEKKLINDRLKDLEELRKIQGKLSKEQIEEKQKLIQEEKILDASEAKRKDDNNAKELENNKKRNEELRKQNKANAEKKKQEEEQKRQEEIAAEFANLQRRAQLIEDHYERELQLLNIKHMKERAAAEKAGEDLILLAQVQNQEMEALDAAHLKKLEESRKAIDDLIEQRRIDDFTAREKELYDIQTKYAKEAEIAKGNAELLLAIETDKNNALAQKKKEFAEQDAEMQRQIDTLRIESMVATANSASQLLTQIAGKNKALAIAALALEKAAAIAAVVINAGKEMSANAVTASLNPANALTFGAAGAAQLAKMNALTKIRTGINIASITAAGINGAKQINTSGGGSVGAISSPAQQLQAPTLTPNQQGIRMKDNRVYVLESDISTTQRRVRTLESRSVVD
jgi:hypothetical protein